MKLKKIIVTMMATIFASASFVVAGTGVYAAETTKEAANDVVKETVLSESEMKAQAVASLKFYLEDAGYIDQETHQYVPTDFNALKEKAALPGAEGQEGKFIFDNFVAPIMYRDLNKYAQCVVINSLPFGGIIWDVLQGNNVIQTLINALQGHNYGTAVDILVGIAKKTLTPSQFAKFNVATIAASIAINAVSCWGT